MPIRFSINVYSIKERFILISHLPITILFILYKISRKSITIFISNLTSSMFHTPFKVTTINSSFLIAIYSITMILIILKISRILYMFCYQLSVSFSLIKMPFSIVNVIRRWMLLLITCISSCTMSHIIQIIPNISHICHCIMKVSSSVWQTINQWSFIVRTIFIVNYNFFNLRLIVRSVANLRFMLNFPNMKRNSLTPFWKKFKIIFFNTVIKHLWKEFWSFLLADLLFFPRFISWTKFNRNWNLSFSTIGRRISLLFF